MCGRDGTPRIGLRRRRRRSQRARQLPSPRQPRPSRRRPGIAAGTRSTRVCSRDRFPFGTKPYSTPAAAACYARRWLVAFHRLEPFWFGGMAGLALAPSRFDLRDRNGRLLAMFLPVRRCPRHLCREIGSRELGVWLFRRRQPSWRCRSAPDSSGTCLPYQSGLVLIPPDRSRPAARGAQACAGHFLRAVHPRAPGRPLLG